ncbi:tRNA-modifying protein YgfZ [Glaciecola petra]|uniref:tRNA-modifying protein YgfZ n=1 Tax=Glaciecola petra TaxID=3075602 RepID=A0ABU2ZTT8_9ALTE|nr:tRNA-modifying protein YgfZ [Aestuariibacter sp. P117]MDT0595820.1 tRNA-modifying protein YgfZ [Aestuariibacter sp. P117]
MNQSKSFLALLDDISVINVAGEQAHEYLHGQVTVATNPFDVASAKIAAHCDFKGKMFSTMFVSYSEALDASTPHFKLWAHTDGAKESLLQLKKYGVFSKVDIAIDTDVKVYGGFGEHCFEQLHVFFPSLNKQHLSVQSNQFGQIITFNDNTMRFLVCLTTCGQERLADVLNGEKLVDKQYWDRLEILAGLANIQQATVGEYVPQMLNLQSIGAIDFDKGCYMGQEVVARTKFLGKNKRACFIAKCDAQDVDVSKVSVASAIEIKLGENWRRAGSLNRFAIADKELHVLVVLPIDTEIGSIIRIKDSNILLTIGPLPYNNLN